MVNNFVEVLTGEGKSITLAIVSAVFALFGYDVSVACYSEYLSKRDYEDFAFLFEKLGVKHFITYDTFNALCEK